MSFNKIFIVGYVGQDPRINEVNGKKVANYSVATTRKAGNEDKTTWFSCTSWEKQAEFIEKYVKKGALLYVEGELDTRTYTDAQGATKCVLEVLFPKVQLLGTGVSQADDDLPD